MNIIIPSVRENFAARVARKVGEFNIATINVPPAEHRLKNVVGLSLGIYLGREFMNLATARNWDGTEKRKEDVPSALQPLYNIMPYNKASDDPRDRWLKVIDNTVPAALGGVGAYYGSYDFFASRTYKNLKDIHAKVNEGKMLTLAEANIAAAMEQGEVWRVMSAFGTMLGSSSGSAWFPWPGNFGVALGSSFNKGLGRTMGGKLWEPLATFISGFTEAIEPANKIFTDELFPKLTHYVFNTHKADIGKLDLNEFTPYMAQKVREALSRHMDHKFRSEVGQEHLAEIVEKLKAPFETLVNTLNDLKNEGKLNADNIGQFEKWSKELGNAVAKDGLLEHVVWEVGAHKNMKVQQHQGMVEQIANFMGAKPFVQKVENAFKGGYAEIASHGGVQLGKRVKDLTDMAAKVRL